MAFAVMRSKSVQTAIILSVILHAVNTTFTDCGGDLTQQAGVITSPNFPETYPAYTQCFWTITVAQDQVIDLSFQRLDLRRRRDQDCYDYLSVYDGPDQTSPFIENKLCGYQNDLEVADIRLRSTGNQMHLYFYTSSGESWPGFSASYWAHNACLPFTYGRDDCNTSCACNQNNTLYCNSVNGSCVCKEGWTSSLCTVDIDECRDPNSCPDVYSECVNTDGSFECPCKAGLSKNATGYCDGSGVCEKGTRLEHTGGSTCIECDDWTFGYSCINNCACYQRNTESCDKVDGLCNCYLNWTGNDCREDVDECWPTNLVCNTTSSRCYDTTGSYECQCNSGYENVDGNHQSCQECGRVFTEPSGSIFSWKYYDTYNTEECSWTIRVDEGKVISLNVSKFTYQSRYPSFLEFYDGGSSSSRSIQRLYSTYSTFFYEGIIRTSANEMHIVLYTPRCGSQRTEFMASYWSHDCPKDMYGEKCEKQCVCNSNTAYCNSTTGQCVCKEGWRSENCSVDIDECSEDALACPDYSNCENLNGSHNCTCKDGLTYVNGLCKAPKSSGNLSCTDSSCLPLCVTTQPGTKQCYCPVGMVLDSDMCIECKNMTYGPDCSHTCNCVRDHTASCDPRNGTCMCVTGWTGDMCEEDVDECVEDECGITPCTPWSRSTCHNTKGSYNCTCDYRYGYVKTGKDTCEQINCSYSYIDMYGNISSPNYPEDYFLNMDCSWSITVNPGFVISLRFSDFDVFYRDDVEVHDGNSTNAPVIGHYTSDSIPRITRSRGNSMYIVLHSGCCSGSSGFTGTYVSHPCQEFTYGEVDCDTQCPCERLNTFHCENTNGWCLCKDGWTGSDCTENVNECLGTNVDLCPENSDCEDTVGSYKCICHPGYVFNETTQVCDEKSECTEKPCSHSCIITDKNEERCVCPDDLVLDRAKNLTCVVPYYPYGPANGDNNLDIEGDESRYYYLVSEKIEFNPGVPFGKTEQSFALVMTSGLISFGSGFVPPFPNLTEAVENQRNFVAPFWARTEKYKGQTHYQLYEKCPASAKMSPSKDTVMGRAKEDVIKFHELHGFEVNTVLLVTWEAVEPLGSQGDEQNTFQGIYISGWKKEIQFGREVLLDEQTAYVIFMYQQGMMNWKYMGRTVEVGTTYSGRIQTKAELLSELPGNAGYNGVLTFEIGRVGGDKQKCHKYVCNHAELLSDPVYEAERNDLYNCPCTLERLGRQWQLFEKRGENDDIYCYAISFLAKQRLKKENKRNKLCCYKWVKNETSDWYAWERARRQAPFVTGHVLINDPWLLQNFDNFQALENIKAQKWCCDVHNEELCEGFYKVFPKQSCTDFVNFVVASALGDPHITTLDGLTYTMNGWGEYVMLDIPTEKFTLQARTGRAESSNGTLTNATVFTAFAAKESNYSSFQVELATTNTSMVIIANGIDLTNEFYDDFEFDKTTETIRVARELSHNKIMAIATFPCGVTMKVSVGVKSLQIEFELDKSLQNTTRGLLGNFNGEKSDDFTLPNGTVLASNISEREVFQHFGKSWEVTAENSVFTYNAGENATDYQHPNFVPMFRDEADPNALADAEKVCGTENDACIFDYLVTRDSAFAENTKQSKERNDNMLKDLENHPPTIVVKSGNISNNNQLIIHNGTETEIEYQTEDEDADDTVELEFVTGSIIATKNKSGTVTISQFLYNGPEVIEMLGVRAIDSKGGSSAVIYTQLLVCTGCSGHGKCSNTTVRERKPGDSFFKLACNCLPAYTGDDCESEVDACESKPCFKGQTCTDLTAAEQGNNSTGYTCGPCPDGFTKSNELCIDINECSTDNHCDQMCTNIEGSYFCHCLEGYRVDPADKHKCSDIDECGEKLHKCEGYCYNQPGNYFCGCWNDYVLREDGYTCRQAFQKGHVCMQKSCDQKCKEVEGQANCSCGNGFETDSLDETKCLDVNECELDNMPCSQVCNNTVGSFSCSCYPGYTLDVDRVSCSPCEEPYYGENCANVCQCSGRGTCDPVRGCVCDDAWIGTNCEADVDECTNPNACPVGLLCYNEIGSYSCLCQEGFQKTDTGSCEDINECVNFEASITCDLRIETCENTVGSYRCLCQRGFVLENSKCRDINECATRGDACEQVCENVPGSYNCLCNPGYKLAADRHSCVKDKDFCLNSNLNCSHICSVNATGLPYCTCPRGYQLISSETCEDINECEQDDKNHCSYKDKYCLNKEGSYQCSCPAGYRLENDGRSCHACTGDTWGVNCAKSCACGVGTDYCNSTTGCVCLPGYTGQHCNEDINECQNGQVTCPSKEVCLNIPGNAACVCQDGYTRRNGNCVDIDECADPRANICPHECSNTEGSFSCSCFTGYTFRKDTGSCEDVDECSDNAIAKCQQICTNTEGSYRCSCTPGLLLQPDGVSCDSTLPCPKNHSCSDQCINIGGNLTCLCPKGKVLSTDDTSLCKDVDLCANATCSDGCVETNGNRSYQCVCRPGQQLEADHITCSDCPESKWGMDCSNQCQCVKTNTDSCNKVNGSCTCKTGWKGDLCDVDINECAENSTLCPAHASCRNTNGSFVCVCDAGYFNSDSSDDGCKECDSSHYGPSCSQQCTCGEHEDCNKVDGSCTCTSRWTGPDCNTDVDECHEGTDTCKVSKHEECKNTDGSFYCVCHKGYERNCSSCECTDIDLCATASCSDGCIETNGNTSYQCVCRPGQHLEPDNVTCIDTDLCATASCSDGCIETNGNTSYQCVCRPGQHLEADNVTCSDTDLCATASCSYGCIETNGNTSYQCVCRPGQHLKPDNVTCSYTDLCATASCSDGCIETNGNTSYQCVCRPGQHLEADNITCSDIDLCATASCGDGCIETNGNTSYQCVCRPGQHLEADNVTCSDIDLCATASCSDGCIETNGNTSYQCVCRPGQHLEADNVTCSECDLNHYGPSCSLECKCGEYEICDKVDGTCTCIRGWTGPHCNTDVDECDEGTHTCEVSRHEECKNKEEGFDCVCHSGYHRTCPLCECTDIDECRNSTHLKHNCSQVCINEEGGFRCDCTVGFRYNETDNTCGEISTHLVETVFEYDTSKVDFTEGSEDMKRLSKDIEEKMTDRLSAQGLTVISVIVIELREGSLIAPMSIKMVGKTQNSSTELTRGLLQAMDDDPMVLDNRLAKIKQINSSGEQFAATESKCEWKQKLEPCTGRRQCVVSDGVARCKLTDDGDEEALILGLEIGVPLFLIVCIVVGATVIHRIRKDKMKDKSVLVRKERGHTGMGDAMRVSTGDDRYKREFASATNPAFSRDDTYLTRASRGSTWLEHPLVNQQGASTFLGQRIELTELRADYSRMERRRDEFEGHRPQQRAKSASFGNEFSYIYRGSGMYQGVAIPRVGEPKPDYGHH